MRAIVLSLASFLLVPNVLAADSPPKTGIFFAQGITFPIGFQEPLGAPLSVSEGVRMSHPLSGGTWSWMVEAGASTPLTSMTPSVYATTGPAEPLSGKMLLGEGVLWKWTPGYDGAPAVHFLGGAVAPLFRVSFGTITLPIGVGCTVSETPACSASLGAKFLVRLNE